MSIGRLLIGILIAAAVAVGLGGCPTATKTVTISGTLSGGYTDTTLVTIRVTNANGTFSTDIDVGSRTFSIPYSIPDVPVGTYSLEVVFQSSFSSGQYLSPGCTIDGIDASVTVSDDGGTPYTITESVSNVDIESSETIDFDIGGVPV